jgi:hypothetical protein
MYRGKVVQTRDAGGLVLDPADQGEWSRFWEAFCPSGNIAPENLRANSVRRCFSIIEPVALSCLSLHWAVAFQGRCRCKTGCGRHGLFVATSRLSFGLAPRLAPARLPLRDA